MLFGVVLIALGIANSSSFIAEKPQWLDMKRCLQSAGIRIRGHNNEWPSSIQTPRRKKLQARFLISRHTTTLFAMRPMSDASSSSASSSTNQDDIWSLEELRRRIQEYLQNRRLTDDRTLHPGLCVVVAGGGGSFLSALTATPGASAILMDGTVLYGRESYKDYLDLIPTDARSESIVSIGAAAQLADAACRRALRLMATHGNNNSGSTRRRDIELRHYRSARGVSCTSVLQSQTKNGGVVVSGNNKNDSTRTRNSTAYLACRGSLSDDPTVALHVDLSRSGHNRSRFDEDVFVGHLVLTTLQLFDAVSMVDYDNDAANALLPAGLTVVHSTTTRGDDLKVKSALGDEIRIQIGRNRYASTRGRIEAAAERILSGQDKVVLMRPNDDLSDFEVLHSAHLLQHSLVFPGSFNPPHRGHVALARASAEAMDRCDMVYFEISITNPDKPSIPAAEVATRVLQFLELDNSTNGNWGILLTDAPLFVQKATILAPRYGHLTFAIGSDTLVRLIDPKYYNDSPVQMLTALHTMNCNYIVGGRVVQQKLLSDAGAGAFVSGLELLKDLPEALAARFQILPEFRVDISSTELRQQQQQQK
jgi:Competence-damaged protein/Cytidylyltransferase-like